MFTIYRFDCSSTLRLECTWVLALADCKTYAGRAVNGLTRSENVVLAKAAKSVVKMWTDHIRRLRERPKRPADVRCAGSVENWRCKSRQLLSDVLQVCSVSDSSITFQARVVLHSQLKSCFDGLDCFEFKRAMCDCTGEGAVLSLQTEN